MLFRGRMPMNYRDPNLHAAEAVLPLPPPAAAPALSAAAKLVAAGLSKTAVSPVLIAGFARLIEFSALLVAGAIVFLAYVVPEEGFVWRYAVPLIGGSFLVVLIIQLADGYSMSAFRRGALQLGRVYLAWTLVFGVFAMVAFLAKTGDGFSRVWAGSWYLAGLAVFTGFRLALASQVREWIKSGRLERRAVIVGGGEPAATLIRAVEADPDSDLKICGIFDDRKDGRSPAVVAGYPRLGTISELVEFGRIARIDLLIVSLPISAENRVLDMLRELWVLPVDIRLSAHTNRLRFRPRTYSFVGKVPFLDVIDKPIAGWDHVSKWLLDRVVGGLILLAAAPMMALVALAIKLDSRGPILFKQKRYGFNNELIEVYKFRSMSVDKADGAAVKLVTRDDPRVTRVGRFIRKTSLDELPQLFNVVIEGNLSLVGPRPHALQAKAADRLYDQVVDGYFARHRVKPGITGWAQVNGWRGETDTAEKLQRRVEHDLHYIENWSVPFDLYILAVTPLRLFKTENAY
jgi:Undecaprenyl-phosphate glucose phosphotransferase